MTLLTVGFNHQTAPLSIRERIAFPTGDAIRSALAELRERLPQPVGEAAILSTCNRTEIYLQADEASARDAGLAIEQWFGDHGRQYGLAGDQLSGHLYTLPDARAIEHAFRVACGLDSMVIGEPQILGQMKEAARLAQSSHTLGSHLHQLFQRAFSVAKRVRSSTAIGSHSVSMAAASVKLGQRIFEDIAGCNVLLIGAGEMIELCAAHWAGRTRQLTIANRTVERASSLASQHGARAIALGELPEGLGQYDVVISCTASTLPIIGLGMVERAVRRRRHKPMLMIDLAVPRDIETDVERLDDVFLYTVDDLRDLVDTGLEERRAAVADAEAIIATEVEAFLDWLRQRSSVPLIRELHRRGHALREAELQHARRQLARGEDPSKVMEALSIALTNKFLHGPTRMLNRHGALLAGPGTTGLASSSVEPDDLLRQLIPDPRR